MEEIVYTLSVYRAQRINHDYTLRVCAAIDRLHLYLADNPSERIDPLGPLKTGIESLYKHLCDERAHIEHLVGEPRYPLRYGNPVQYTWGVSGELPRLWISCMCEYDELCKGYLAAYWSNHYDAIETMSLQIQPIRHISAVWSMLNRPLQTIIEHSGNDEGLSDCSDPQRIIHASNPPL